MTLPTDKFGSIHAVASDGKETGATVSERDTKDVMGVDIKKTEALPTTTAANDELGRFKKIQDAYRVLSHPAMRRLYDLELLRVN